ncbi:hypothetical protein O181_075135 [Austropuccinia psidii MF-1]|uniref:Uncharacterized protein n=1 Tax=Austropuccinia psidii MF-1 TaxID=1389203 RepID=A0A9Q3IDQ8_9BASI|nr:hypothetical protein [Austropuccinia psidii MF-1]
MSTLPSIFQLKRHLNIEDWNDMDEILQINQLHKDLLYWSMENERLKQASHWEELVSGCHKIFPEENAFNDNMEITIGWNPDRQFKILKERVEKITKTQATI